MFLKLLPTRYINTDYLVSVGIGETKSDPGKVSVVGTLVNGEIITLRVYESDKQHEAEVYLKEITSDHRLCHMRRVI